MYWRREDIIDMSNIADRKVGKDILEILERAPKKDHKRCVGYMRVSTPGQAALDANMKHEKPALQAEAMRIFFNAGLHDGTVYENVFEKLGYVPNEKYGPYFFDIASGSANENRPGFQEVLRLLNSRKIDAVVVAYADRLARNDNGSSDIRNALQHAKGMVIEVGDNDRGANCFTVYDYSSNDPSIIAFNDFRLATALSGATTYSRERSSSARTATKKAVDSQIYHTGGNGKFGFEWVVDPGQPEGAKFRKGHYEINGTEADIVRDIYALYAWGIGGKPKNGAFPEKWEGLGITSIQKVVSKRYGLFIRRDFVERLLHDRSYVDGSAVFRSISGQWGNTSVKSYMERLGLRRNRRYTVDEKKAVLEAIDRQFGTNYLSDSEKRYPGVYPIIVKDRETADRVANRFRETSEGFPAPRRMVGIDENGNAVAERGWLSGILYCPYCGKKYFRAHKGNGSDKGFYVSGALAAGINCPNQIDVSYTLEDAVFNIVAEIVLHDSAYASAYRRFCAKQEAEGKAIAKGKKGPESVADGLRKTIDALLRSERKIINHIDFAIDSGDRKAMDELGKKRQAIADQIKEARERLREEEAKENEAPSEKEAASLIKQRETMRALYEKNPKAITVAQKEAFVKAFVTKVCFRHKRKNLGTAANPVYGREYEEVGETGWKDAIVDIEMKWVAGAAEEWSGFVNLHGKDGKPLFDGDEDFRKENGYMLSAAHSEEDDEPIVFGDGLDDLKKKGGGGKPGSGSSGPSGSGQPSGGSDGNGDSALPFLWNGQIYKAFSIFQQSDVGPIPGTFLISSSRRNKAVPER
jgi:hypothetical protein